MLVAALVFAGLAAVVHGYIFVLESLRWTAPATRRTFGTSEEQAAMSRDLAFNQGFYNLFLAVLAAAGVVITALGERPIGTTLVFAATGSMVAAGLVLILSSPSRARPALVQLVPPAIAIVLLVLAVST